MLMGECLGEHMVCVCNTAPTDWYHKSTTYLFHFTPVSIWKSIGKPEKSMFLANKDKYLAYQICVYKSRPDYQIPPSTGRIASITCNWTVLVNFRNQETVASSRIWLRHYERKVLWSQDSIFQICRVANWLSEFITHRNHILVQRRKHYVFTSSLLNKISQKHGLSFW